MAKQTLQQRIIDALETLGCKRVEGRSNKYIVLTKMRDDGFYFVGKNGALRSGKNVTSSVSLQGIISLEKLFAAAERKRQCGAGSARSLKPTEDDMEKYRIVISPIKSENYPVILFRMKSGATDSSDINSWEIVGEFVDLPTCFKEKHLPFIFKTVGQIFNPVTLQNF